MLVDIHSIVGEILKENKVNLGQQIGKLYRVRHLACFILRYRKLASKVKDPACFRVSYNQKEAVLPPSVRQLGNNLQDTLVRELPPSLPVTLIAENVCTIKRGRVTPAVYPAVQL